MLKIQCELDDEKTSFLGIEARGTLPQMSAELEILVRQVITGMVRQLPNDRTDAARAMFSIAVMNGITRQNSDE